jgi:hypothetical protein
MNPSSITKFESGEKKTVKKMKKEKYRIHKKEKQRCIDWLLKKRIELVI